MNAATLEARAVGWPRNAKDWILAAAVVLVTIVVTDYLFRDTMFAFGEDVILHTTLAEALRNVYILPESSRGVLQEMFDYPSFAHRIAAFLLNRGLDPVNALNLTAVGATGAIWLMLLALVNRASRIGLLSFATISLAAILTLSPGMLAGYEVIGNFFYGQIVGDSVFLIASIVLMRAARLGNGWKCLAFAALAVFVTAQFHLLPAIRLLLVAMLTVALLSYRRFERERRLDAVFLSVGLGVLPAAFILSPAFRAMRRLADHNGVLEFAIPISPGALFVVSSGLVGVAAAAIAAQLRADHKAQAVRVVKHADASAANATARDGGSAEAAEIVYVIAAAVAFAAIAQCVIFTLFDMGSPYAVNKHVFGVTTFGLAALAVAAGVALDKIVLPATRQPSLAVSAILIVGCYAALMAALFVRPNVIDVPRLVKLSRDIELTKATMPGFEAGPALFVSSSVPPMLNYYVTVALLGSPRDANAHGLQQGYWVADAAKVARFVTEPGDKLFDRPACHIAGRGNPLAVMTRQCFETAPPSERGLDLDQTLAFGASDDGPLYLKSGWSRPEPWGTWSISTSARVVIPIADNLPNGRLAIEVVAQGFVSPQSALRVVRASVDGRTHATMTFTPENAVILTTMPVDAATLSKRFIEIRFDVADPVSPAQLGLSPDRRSLGVGIRSIRLVRAKADSIARDKQ